jgi:hypothetical protein
MIKRIVLVLLSLTSVTANAQYNCSIQRQQNVTAGTVDVSPGYGWQGPFDDAGATIGAATAQWDDSCGDEGAGSGFPYLESGTGSGYPVTVNYHSEPGPACGSNSTLYYQGTPLGSTIDLYASAGGSPCDPISDSLAHELGHVLGLEDVSYAGSCFGSIMGGRSPGGTRSVTAADCAAADEGWWTPEEQIEQDTQNACTQTCRGQCFEGQCDSTECFQWGDGHYSTGCYSPILINVSGGGYHLTSAADGVLFDLDADGHLNRTAWTRDSGDAFLCRDLNGNGTIDNGRELFGNYTVLANGNRAINGYQALATFDKVESGGNGNGWIDPEDSVWDSLLLWTDSNHDGVSQSDELASLNDAHVLRIDAHYIESPRQDQYGNLFRFRGQCILAGPNGSQHPRVTYDVFFVTAP